MIFEKCKSFEDCKKNILSVAQNLQITFGLTIVNEIMRLGVLSVVWVGV